MKTTKLLALFALALPTAAHADALPKPIADMECLVGTWKGTGTLTMGKDKAKLDVTWTCKRTSAQHGVLCNAVITGIPGLDRYEETDLFGYDPNTATYHWFSVTNGGETHDHVAKPPKGSRVQFAFTGTQEGKPLRELVDLEFAKDSKSLALRSETIVGGTSLAVLEARMRK